jgi:DNA-binding transcriptional LysR family regulator
VDGFCVLLPKSHHLAAWRELPLSVMNEGRIITLAGTTTLPGSVASGDGGGAAPLGSFIVMPGIDSLKHAVAEGLGIAIVPRASSTVAPGPAWLPYRCRRPVARTR